MLNERLLEVKNCVVMKLDDDEKKDSNAKPDAIYPLPVLPMFTASVHLSIAFNTENYCFDKHRNRTLPLVSRYSATRGSGASSVLVKVRA